MGWQARRIAEDHAGMLRISMQLLVLDGAVLPLTAAVHAGLHGRVRETARQVGVPADALLRPTAGVVRLYQTMRKACACARQCRSAINSHRLRQPWHPQLALMFLLFQVER
jgi:hypothetical protein